MRVNANVFWIIGVFFVITAAAYTVWVVGDAGWDWSKIEWVGTVALALSAILGFFLGYYITATHKAQGADIAADLDDADIDDDDPEIGHFAPWSWWPLVLGTALAIVFLGIAAGFWIAYIGVAVAVVAIVGWTYEYYRKNFVR